MAAEYLRSGAGRSSHAIVEHNYHTFSKWYRDPHVWNFLLDEVLWEVLARRSALPSPSSSPPPPSSSTNNQQTPAAPAVAAASTTDAGSDKPLAQARPVVRAWSLGCSGGEEAYSLALLWSEGIERLIERRCGPGTDRSSNSNSDTNSKVKPGSATATLRPSPILQVLGTDSEPAAILAAQRGVFTPHSVQDIPPAWLERCLRSEQTPALHETSIDPKAGRGGVGGESGEGGGGDGGRHVPESGEIESESGEGRGEGEGEVQVEGEGSASGLKSGCKAKDSCAFQVHDTTKASCTFEVQGTNGW